MEQTRTSSFIVLCVDAIENGRWQGRYYYDDLANEHHFCSMDTFILENDKFFCGMPYCTNSTPRDPHAIVHNGAIATFKLRILYRHNSDWQGSILWLETRHEEYFRSVLELLSILHQAISLSQKQRMSPSSLKKCLE